MRCIGRCARFETRSGCAGPLLRACKGIGLGPMRPSRRPPCGLLRMKAFLNASKGLPHAEGARSARLEARKNAVQSIPSDALSMR